VSLDGAAHLGTLSWIGPRDRHYRDGTELVSVEESFYSTRFYTDRMVDYIESDRGDGRPFFAYLAYTAPHWPLQAPDESIAKFEGWYDDGYEALYRRRLDNMKKLGLVAPNHTAVPPIDGQPAWEDLSAGERHIEARKMEIYAAMVSDLDHYVGEFIRYLKSIDEFDNTFIMFISDNGPEAMRLDLQSPIREWVETCCDNTFENLGKGDSYVMYGPNWARAGSAPFRRAKWTAFEGGIHVPAFVRYDGVVAPGTRNDAVATVMDIYPTFLSLAETEHPGSTYRGEPVLPVRGKSLLPILSRAADYVHDESEFFGWEIYGRRAVRQGDWKIVWDPDQEEAVAWQLFNLADDPSEQNDLASREPDRLQAMIALWAAYVRENGVIPGQ
jgi:arylsulfatase